ncbi:tRNA guanosine(34) transglycosylase Tgt [Rhodovibrionaceae bacterium A322]
MSYGIDFDLMAQDGKARRGRITTAHGEIDTPAFMPVGTVGTVKSQLPEQVKASGAQILLGNTYHLMLRPGAERVARLGGLHKFMNWPHPILTDSGGFQVMSLNDLRKITEEGVTFASHIDGSKHFLTPERSVEIQELLDSNITMVLDECTPYPATREQAQSSMEMSMRWAARSKEAFTKRPGYGLFGIVQGSTFEDLRHRSVDALKDIGFDGYAVGGLAVGEGQEMMLKVLGYTLPRMLTDRPRYLMGVGTPSDLVESVKLGIDMFDCVMPTRSGRTGQGFTHRGKINIKNARHKDDPRPLDSACSCPTCRDYSRAYVHHLFKAEEILGAVLLTQHNIYYYQNLMAGMRSAIEAGELTAFSDKFYSDWNQGDIDPL